MILGVTGLGCSKCYDTLAAFHLAALERAAASCRLIPRKPLSGSRTMSKAPLFLTAVAMSLVFASFSAQAIDKKYAQKLERSGCTQVTEMQGCDINKTKAENAKAGFGLEAKAKPAPAPHYKDLAGKSSIGALDSMTERGFKSVDSFESGNTQYGIYYHADSHLCVQLTMADGKVVSADDIHTHPKCH